MKIYGFTYNCTVFKVVLNFHEVSRPFIFTWGYPHQGNLGQDRGQESKFAT